MLFARDNGGLEFNHEGRQWAVVFVGGFLYIFRIGFLPLCNDGWSNARKWFIDHQREFNLEGYS